MNSNSEYKIKNSIRFKIILYVMLSFVVFLIFYYEDSKEDYLINESDVDDLNYEYLDCYAFLADYEIDVAKENLIRYIDSKYEASVLYEDLNTEYRVGLNVDKRYYAASTIKLLDALYIYKLAVMDEMILDQELIYESKFYKSSSMILNNMSFNIKISLRDLVEYVIRYSDNSAHAMLIDYIGKDNLKEFGHSLGASLILNSKDNFGYIDVTDALIYLKELNNFINNNGKLGMELKKIFINSYNNSLEMIELGIMSAHKYGYYGKNYHDIGIVYDEHPYVVAILTLEGSKENPIEIVKDINRQVYEFHKFYNDKKSSLCNSE